MNGVDEYIKSFPEEVQERLTVIRNIIRELAPQATERICMRMPTYDLNGKWLVHFAALRSISDFIRSLKVLKHLKKNCPDIKLQREQCNFRWTSHFR